MTSLRRVVDWYLVHVRVRPLGVVISRFDSSTAWNLTMGIGERSSLGFALINMHSSTLAPSSQRFVANIASSSLLFSSGRTMLASIVMLSNGTLTFLLIICLIAVM